MADVLNTCANCGNAQTSGDFCEKCGTRMPAAATPVASSTVPSAAAPSAAAAVGAAAYGASRQSTPPPAASAAAAPPPYSPQYGATPQYGAGPSGPGAPRYDYPRSRGFFSRLFDFSFEEFITPSIIKILFIISIVVIGLGVLGGIIFGFMASAGTGVMFLIGGLIYGFLMLLYVRVILELFIVFFRIHDNTEDIVKSKR